MELEQFKGQHPRFPSNAAAARSAWAALYVLAREVLMELERAELEALPASVLFRQPVVVVGEAELVASQAS